MSNKKSIDRLFQEKFKDFEVAPSDAVWNRIEQRLDRKKKKRRIIPIWWQVGGAAAALVLLFAIGNSLFNTDNQNIPKVVGTDKPSNAVSEDEQNTNKNIKATDNTTIAADDSYTLIQEDTVISSTKSSERNQLKTATSNRNKASFGVASTNPNSSKKSNFNKNTLNQNNTLVAKEEYPVKQSNEVVQLKSNSEIESIITDSKTKNNVAHTLIEKHKKKTEKQDAITEANNINDLKKETKDVQTIEEAIAEANNINEKEKEKLRRWSIAPSVAPVYFNSLGNGSSIDEQFNENATSNAITMSYGIDGSYAISNRLKITTGVHRVSLNNTINDVLALSDNTLASRNASAIRMENVTLKSSADNSSLMVISRANLNKESIPESINTLPTGDLEQRFGFIEIPLELEYKVIDKKLGVNVVGGFSTLFLNENEIFADVNGESTLIGEANNLNDTSFSANFGIGLDYSLSKKLNINLEPKFKYQLNTFNNTSGNFQPFFIGVYTGLSFKF